LLLRTDGRGPPARRGPLARSRIGSARLAESHVEPDDFVMLLARHKPPVRAFAGVIIDAGLSLRDGVLAMALLPISFPSGAFVR
jgi:hypothetical protein